MFMLRGEATSLYADPNVSSIATKSTTYLRSALINAIAENPPATTTSTYNKCPDGWVLTEFGCMNPTQSTSPCPPGSTQTGNGCLPAISDPPPIVQAGYAVQTTAPTTVPETPYVAPVVVAPQVPVDQPTPGTVVYSTVPETKPIIPRWAWWLGLGVVTVGGVALVRRARRR